MSPKSVVGVDVAKRTFDMFISGSSKPKTYRNTKRGIDSFIKSLQLLVAPFVIMEATGSYQRDLTRRLRRRRERGTRANGKRPGGLGSPPLRTA